MISRQKYSENQDEKCKLVENGLKLAKEAVQLDTHDGSSWIVLGNAHLSSFFGISQSPRTLKQCLSAYSQAVGIIYKYFYKMIYKFFLILFL